MEKEGNHIAQIYYNTKEKEQEDTLFRKMLFQKI